ncbi:BQ5605_C011g06455 [Microbotryum silenes-dioicae]|uniref:BQ5605_C011g06455 protein n=1 Tax=Microbotryum silenes-dioicae TaxID=796604 RepID=A0A2X0M9T7_9BASI|nr:BQ5605_C011g06455 [Microbotryum silenes-dioicae]
MAYYGPTQYDEECAHCGSSRYVSGTDRRAKTTFAYLSPNSYLRMHHRDREFSKNMRYRAEYDRQRGNRDPSVIADLFDGSRYCQSVYCCFIPLLLPIMISY